MLVLKGLSLFLRSEPILRRSFKANSHCFSREPTWNSTILLVNSLGRESDNLKHQGIIFIFPCCSLSCHLGHDLYTATELPLPFVHFSFYSSEGFNAFSDEINWKRSLPLNFTHCFFTIYPLLNHFSNEASRVTILNYLFHRSWIDLVFDHSLKLLARFRHLVSY